MARVGAWLIGAQEASPPRSSWEYMPFPRRLEGRLELCPLPWHQDEPAVHLLRQAALLPAHPLFASPERSGERYPNAEAALESTLIIGSQS